MTVQRWRQIEDLYHAAREGGEAVLAGAEPEIRDEVEKLLRHGEGWLASHPERETITRRYLKHQRTLVDDALARSEQRVASGQHVLVETTERL